MTGFYDHIISICPRTLYRLLPYVGVWCTNTVSEMRCIDAFYFKMHLIVMHKVSIECLLFCFSFRMLHIYLNVIIAREGLQNYKTYSQYFRSLTKWSLYRHTCRDKRPRFKPESSEGPPHLITSLNKTLVLFYPGTGGDFDFDHFGQIFHFVFVHK